MLQVMRYADAPGADENAETDVSSPNSASATRIPAAVIEEIHHLPVLPDTRRVPVQRVTLRHILIALTLLRPGAVAAQSAAVQPIAIGVDARPASVSPSFMPTCKGLDSRYPFARIPASDQITSS
jgi:hypothetical protein